MVPNGTDYFTQISQIYTDFNPQSRIWDFTDGIR